MIRMNKKLKNYVAFVEVKPLQKCEIYSPEIVGAYVRCYIADKNEDAAIKRIKKALSEDFFEIVNVEWCVDYDSTEWENPDSDEGDELVKEAQKTGNVIYGEFHVWEEDDEE